LQPSRVRVGITSDSKSTSDEDGFSPAQNNKGINSHEFIRNAQLGGFSSIITPFGVSRQEKE
jgi:hypothetical protein